MGVLISKQAKHAMFTRIRIKYQSSNWKTKHQLLDGFILATGYDRKYAIRLLNGRSTPSTRRVAGQRKCRYDASVVGVLKMLWHVCNQICSKRLVPFLPELVRSLERHGHLHLSETVRAQVLTVSPATFDRLLRGERKKSPQRVSATTSSCLLKRQISVRTFADWDEARPGFFEADLVAHCGKTVTGVFLNTLVITDIVTTWTECIALIRKSADNIILGLETAAQLLPFSLLGLDVDNGCEFINYDVLNYCKQHHITFTRSRAYKKNDQAHVEEKNGSIVRRLVGYDRYETEAAWEIMCHLYAVLRLYINFFQPSLKLTDKVRQGAKTTKRYDEAKTPYQRVMASEHISQAQKAVLTAQYQTLDPVNLKETIQALQAQLWQHTWTETITPVVDEAAVTEDKLSTSPRYYRRAKSAPRQRDWRTRQDPFAHVQSFIQSELQFDPNAYAKKILDKLMKAYPGDFCRGHLRTLQRRVSDIRSQQAQRQRKYQALMIDNEYIGKGASNG